MDLPDGFHDQTSITRRESTQKLPNTANSSSMRRNQCHEINATNGMNSVIGLSLTEAENLHERCLFDAANPLGPQPTAPHYWVVPLLRLQ
jgi:hypothetical protein